MNLIRSVALTAFEDPGRNSHHATSWSRRGLFDGPCIGQNAISTCRVLNLLAFQLPAPARKTRLHAQRATLAQSSPSLAHPIRRSGVDTFGPTPFCMRSALLSGPCSTIALFPRRGTVRSGHFPAVTIRWGCIPASACATFARTVSPSDERL